jgi:hypothetical protein
MLKGVQMFSWLVVSRSITYVLFRNWWSLSKYSYTNIVHR